VGEVVGGWVVAVRPAPKVPIKCATIGSGSVIAGQRGGRQRVVLVELELYGIAIHICGTAAVD
jgi:hypothetical protein